MYPNEAPTFRLILSRLASYASSICPRLLGNHYTPTGLEQAIVGCARPAETRSLPPMALDVPDWPQVVRFFNNYWVAPADVAWAVQKEVIRGRG
jgi:hypothetical protein